MAKYDVCALGCVCWDLVGTIEEYPAEDEKAAIQRFVQMGGGRSGTAAAAVAALGGSVAIFGRVGDDEFGENIRAEFGEQGVATDGLEVMPGESSQFAFCAAQPATGTRAIFYKHGSMAKMGAEDVDPDALTDCGCLVLDTHHMAASIAGAKLAREKGIPVVLDAERVQPGLEELLAAADYPALPAALVAALGEGNEETGRAQIMAKGPAALVVTRGADGADVYTAAGEFHQPAFAVPQVFDTTGAGDVFHGAYGYCLALGMELAEAVAHASATAALSTIALGGRGYLPAMPEVKALVYGLGSLCSR